jgi:hypothetical protein
MTCRVIYHEERKRSEIKAKWRMFWDSLGIIANGTG